MLCHVVLFFYDIKVVCYNYGTQIITGVLTTNLNILKMKR